MLNKLGSYALAFLLAFAPLQSANAYFLGGESYAGLSLGFLFGESVDDISLDGAQAVYLGPGAGFTTTYFYSDTSDELSGTSALFNVYIGTIDELDISYELSVNWLGNALSDDDDGLSFDAFGIFLDASYDFYSFHTEDRVIAFFSKGGIGIMNLYNIQYDTILEEYDTVDYPRTIEASVHDSSSLGLGLRASIGARTSLNDATSMSLTLSLLYIKGGDSSSPPTIYLRGTEDWLFTGTTVNSSDISLISGALTISGEMLVW